MFRRIVGKILRGRKEKEEDVLMHLMTVPEEILEELEAMGGVDGEAELIRRRRNMLVPPVPRL